MKRKLIGLTFTVAVLGYLSVLSISTSATGKQNITPEYPASPPQPMLGSATPSVGRCDDHAVVCEDVAYREMLFCDFYGLGDCFCKAQRAYNQCMQNVNCPGVSAEAMQAQGCTCLNKSCTP